MISYQKSNNSDSSVNRIDICAGANERFMIGATAAFASLALNAAPETFLCFHIFTENVNPAAVVFMKSYPLFNKDGSCLLRNLLGHYL